MPMIHYVCSFEVCRSINGKLYDLVGLVMKAVFIGTLARENQNVIEVICMKWENN